ncbi:hypothetical protein GCM10007880_57930 [Mesorhizobium amorphae]|nr:hypothetical protein GCM10007880_57930 [Mesorhizobium amorphae]
MLQCACHIRVELPTILGQFNQSVPSMKEDYSEIAFKELDTIADSGLGQAKLFRCGCKASKSCGCLERRQG